MNYQGYQTPIKKRSSAATLRKTAFAAFKEHFWLMIGAFLLASLLGMSTGDTSSVSTREDTSSDTAITEEQMRQEILEIRNRMDAYVEAEDFSGMAEYIIRDVIGIAVVIAFVTALLFSLAYSILVGAPVTVGYHRLNLDLIDGKPALSIGTLFCGFKSCYFKSIGVHLLLAVIDLVLWVGICFVGTVVALFTVFTSPILAVFLVLCVLVAGAALSIWITYRYALCYFILAEYPNLSVMDVLRNSAHLMQGNKFRLFCLQFSFIGWMILATCCTCGFGMYVLSPYMNATKAAFYYEVTGHDIAKEVEFPSLNPDDYFPNID